MNEMNRREAVKLLLSGLLKTTGAIVLASAAAPAPTAETAAKADANRSPEERANEVAEGMPTDEQENCSLAGFRNAAFRNGGFRNAGFRNAGFRNGGFVNSGFRNGGFRNGGFRNFR
jgi:hypothetical protein